MEFDDVEYALITDEESSTESGDSGISQISVEHEEWAYSAFSDILITLHLGAAAVFLAHTVKNIIVELYNPTMATFKSHSTIFPVILNMLRSFFSNLLRAEVLGSLIIIVASISIGREISNFRILRICGRLITNWLSKILIYIVILVHYYCVRIYLETV